MGDVVLNLLVCLLGLLIGVGLGIPATTAILWLRQRWPLWLVQMCSLPIAISALVVALAVAHVAGISAAERGLYVFFVVCGLIGTWIVRRSLRSRRLH
jgi:ABC-type spermidine/putrescine transport system permease subunit II